MNFDITEMTDLSGEMAHIYSVTLKGEEQTLADGVAALRVGQIRLYCLYFDRTAVLEEDGSLTINYWEDEDGE